MEDHQIIADTPGEYTESPMIYQEYSPLPVFAGGSRPVVGSWLVNGYPSGIGIRESFGPVTDNMSRFVPHRFVPSPTKSKKIGFGELRKLYLDGQK